jgi:hypothetical protein
MERVAAKFCQELRVLLGLALLREVGPEVSDGGVAVRVIGVSVLAMAERTSG